jgi:hypothetical protein
MGDCSVLGRAGFHESSVIQNRESNGRRRGQPTDGMATMRILTARLENRLKSWRCSCSTGPGCCQAGEGAVPPCVFWRLMTIFRIVATCSLRRQPGNGFREHNPDAHQGTRQNRSELVG